MDSERLRAGIVTLLREDQRGLSVTEISRKMGLNRNSTAKYLDVLQVSGQVEMRKVGRAKLYYPSFSVPIEAMLNFSSDLILVLDRTGSVLDINKNLLDNLGLKRDMVIGRNMVDTPLLIFEGIDLKRSIRKVIKGSEFVFEKRVELPSGVLYLRGKLLPTSLGDGSKGITVILEDITDEKLTELRLKESEARYRTLFDNSLDTLLVVDENRILDANDATLSLYGLRSKEEVIGKRPWDFSPVKQPDGTDSMEMIKWGMAEVLKGKDFQFEWVQIKKGKGHIQTLMTVRPITLNGKVMVHAMMRDISDLKTSKERALSNEERTRAVMSTAADSFMLLLDPELYLIDIWASESLRRRLRVPVKSEQGWRVLNIIKADDRDRVRDQMNHVISTGDPSRSEIELDIPEGTRWFDMTLGMIKDPSTGERNLVLFARDIDDRHKAMVKLERTAQRCLILDNTLRDVVWIVDEEFRFTFLSTSVKKVLGYDVKELLGQGFDRLLGDEPFQKLRSSLTGLLNEDGTRRKVGANPVLLELEAVRKDGTRIWTEMSLASSRDEATGAVHFVGATRDISRRKNAEHELLRLSRAFQFSREPMVIIDLKGRIMDLNDAAVKLIGASGRGEMIGMDGMSRIVPEEKKRAEFLLEQALGGTMDGSTYMVQDLKGDSFRISVKSSPIPGDDGRTVGLVYIISRSPAQE